MTANKLTGVTLPDGSQYTYDYDYRGRRVGIGQGGTIGVPVQTAVVFSDGLSVAEYESTSGATVAADHPTVEYTRGPDMGGGIGGMLYTSHGNVAGTPSSVRYDLSDARGDIVAQSNESAALTWTASYEAFGRRMVETGTNTDKQRANTKDEDPTGLLNEGFRYRDLETGVFLSRDPAGFVDGPNVYTYVQQNPWTKFDPEGLFGHIAAAALVGAAWGVASQAVSDMCNRKTSSFGDYAAAAIGGAAAGATLAMFGNPTLAGAAGGAAQSASGQFFKHGTVDGGQVLHDAAIGAVGGKMGAVVGQKLGCAASQLGKGLAGATAGALTGAGTQMVHNIVSGTPEKEGGIMAGVGHAALTGAITGAVAGAMQKGCFLAGTSVTLGCGDMMAIESLVVGMRVLTPESQSADSGSETAVDPNTWRQYDVRLRDAESGGAAFDIKLLRPQGWLAEHSRQIAGHSEVWLDFEELDAHGWAQVIQERSCPAIVSGAGRVITATITHANDDVRTLTLDSGESLQVTGNHKMYSATQQDWVRVKHLHGGEALQTTEGQVTVSGLSANSGRHQVYNLEVEEEHCYFVGSSQALAHNMNCKPDAPTEGQKQVNKSKAQLSNDAQTIHETFGAPGTKPYDRKTVATGIVDGIPVYAVSSNKTSAASRQTASNLGYQRVYGSKLIKPNQTHAEQIIMNYAQQQGAKNVSIAPSRPACDHRKQDCNGRMHREGINNIRKRGTR
jgi:RHS repeat-associated protein